MDDQAPPLRPAHEADIPALARLWTEAFPGSQPVARRTRELQRGMPYGTLADCRLVEVDGRVAAALRMYRMEMWFGGQRYPTLGLAGVAVAPDFRRRGLGRRICVEALREGRARGDVLSLLYPFRVAFYRALGYVMAGELHHHRFAPADLPLYVGWERVSGVEKSEERAVRALYDRVAARSNGLLARRRGAWRMALRAGTTLYAYRTGEGRLSGYLSVHTHRLHPPTLAVREMVWEDGEAYQAMLGWLSAQRDQYAQIRYDALPCEAFARRLPHPAPHGARSPRGLWVGSARILVGPMLRVLDVGALQAAGSGEAVHVEDPELPAGQGWWRGGERLGDGATATGSRLSVSGAAEAFLAGTLPGQKAPPEGWTSAAGVSDFRLFDEF